MSSTSCLRIARDDTDVMIKPAPSASLEGFGESSLLFGLSTFVPEPGLSGDVKHRLCSLIQRRFKEEGIVIPYPTHELHVNNRVLPKVPGERIGVPDDAHPTHPYRYDPALKSPPAPHIPAAGDQPGGARDLEPANAQGENR